MAFAPEMLRLNHPDFGAVSPVKLIPIAEAAGLIVPLGEWVTEEACRQLLIWKSQGMPLVPVAVNVSGLQIVHVDFASRFMATLERYAIDPRLIHIEVTETAAMHNVADVTDQMKALSAEGIEFSIDDFGTGHSSLAWLSHLGASILKIDKSFSDTGCTENSHTIVQAIITMAHTLGNKVVGAWRSRRTCDWFFTQGAGPFRPLNRSTNRRVGFSPERESAARARLTPGQPGPRGCAPASSGKARTPRTS